MQQPVLKAAERAQRRGARRRVLVLVAALTVVVTACGTDTGPAAPTPPVQPPVVTPAPPEEPEPTRPTDPEEGAPTPEAEAARVLLLAAARSGDWDAVGALLPEDGFSASFGGETDAVAYYRSLNVDVLAVIVALLEGPSARLEPDLGITVWPDLHVRDPFVVTDEERA